MNLNHKRIVRHTATHKSIIDKALMLNYILPLAAHTQEYFDVKRPFKELRVAGETDEIDAIRAILALRLGTTLGMLLHCTPPTAGRSLTFMFASSDLAHATRVPFEENPLVRCDHGDSKVSAFIDSTAGRIPTFADDDDDPDCPMGGSTEADIDMDVLDALSVSNAGSDMW